MAFAGGGAFLLCDLTLLLFVWQPQLPGDWQENGEQSQTKKGHKANIAPCRSPHAPTPIGIQHCRSHDHFLIRVWYWEIGVPPGCVVGKGGSCMLGVPCDALYWNDDVVCVGGGGGGLAGSGQLFGETWPLTKARCGGGGGGWQRGGGSSQGTLMVEHCRSMTLELPRAAWELRDSTMFRDILDYWKWFSGRLFG